MNKVIFLYSFSNAEFPKDYIEHVLHVDLTNELSQRVSRCTQFFSRELFTVAHHDHASSQRTHRVPQQGPLARAPDQAALHPVEIVPRKAGQRRDQFPKTVAPRSRDRKLR